MRGMMKKWLIPLTVLTLSLAVAGIVIGFTLIGGSDQPNGGIDPDECELVHNLADCDGNPTLEDPPLPTYEDWVNDQGTEVSDSYAPIPSYGIPRPTNGEIVTSIDLIDPDVCNAIHNINACTPEELEELGIAPTTSSITVGEIETGVAVTGNPEPLFVDGEPRRDLHSPGRVPSGGDRQ